MPDLLSANSPGVHYRSTSPSSKSSSNSISVVSAASSTPPLSFASAHPPPKKSITTTEIGGDRVTVLCQLRMDELDYDLHARTERTRTATIMLRGATANHLYDLERAINDGTNVIKARPSPPCLEKNRGIQLQLQRHYAVQDRCRAPPRRVVACQWLIRS